MSTEERDGGSRHYLLGHAENELRRLDLQGALYRETTRRAFVEAGVKPGMRVLDIGCGTGDVTLTVAEIVGTDGGVLGIDRGAEAIATARSKAAALGLGHVDFEVTELEDFERPAAFDAIVGRFILMHQRDPASVLRHLARSVRPRGFVSIVESWMELLRTGGHSQPHSELYEEIVRWKSAVVEGAGADLHAGGRLRTTFVDAGLECIGCRMEALVAGGPDSPYYEYVEESVRSMLPEAARLGLEGFTEATVNGLADRLRQEVVATRGSLLAWPVVAGQARVRGD